MRLRTNSRVIRLLAEECESPGEFLSAVAGIKQISKTELGNILGASEGYVSMMLSDKFGSGSVSLGIRACYKFAKALDIDPYLVASVASRYAMKKEIEKNGF